MPTAIAPREFAKRLIDRAIHDSLDEAVGAKSRRAFSHLLWNVQGRSDLLRPRRLAGRADAQASARLVSGLLALVECRRRWLRPLEGWEPAGVGPLPLFSSLAHHLLARYPVPPVLLSSWFRGPGWPGNRLRHWFLEAAAGGSLRAILSTVRMTRRMAFEFSQAPPHVPIEEALCRARVRGMGGPDALARAVAATRLGRTLYLDPFWSSLISLLMNTPRLDLGRIDPIVEYLYAERFEYRTVVIGEDTEVQLEPPRPELSIKGCTADSLARRAAEWGARRRPGAPERRLFRWEPSGLGGFRREGGDGRAWTIVELLDSDALAAEGKAMRHCVATYTAGCARGRSSIWSLGEECPGGRRRVLTIEVDPESRSVVQASKKCNEDPDEASMALLREWAGAEGLSIDW
ncbi:PcfJ domain-containing protein [Tautonia plasticadhaerens]|uniref:PcfJ-like protein n=1 Tax=Tautonia plasticadhaerens TaxID=2527974 RepID=A0A518H4N2_9BACT|nr:PcfJ domain-containing protein [Tautonia plasticadhaerens]QDV35805.1 hypothetical protein ElP_37130 [Tautonia plasticadhaerens]